MKIIKNPELKGIIILFIVILILGGLMAGTSGKLEQWFGVTLFSGPRLQDKIVFVSGPNGSDIYVMDKDGSHREALTKGAGVLSTPAISSAGNEVIFVAMFGKDKQVASVGARGGELEQLTSATGPKKEPGYTPDGKRLSFIASGKVYASDLNGDNPECVLPTDEEIHAAMSSSSESREIPAYYSYAWAPDSKSLAGITKDNKDDDILVYIPQHDHSSDHSNSGVCPQRRILAVGHVTGYSWAAEKPVLIASVNIGKKSTLLAFDIEHEQGGKIAELDKQEIGVPAISPDATVVVVPLKSINKKAPSGLFKIDLSSGQAQIIAKGIFENPVYSQDGNQVLATVVSDNGEKRDIVLIDVSKGEITQLTHDGNSFNAIWTPVSAK
jgi:Tol biopolymer transport system component